MERFKKIFESDDTNDLIILNTYLYKRGRLSTIVNNGAIWIQEDDDIARAYKYGQMLILSRRLKVQPCVIYGDLRCEISKMNKRQMRLAVDEIDM